MSKTKLWFGLGQSYMGGGVKPLKCFAMMIQSYPHPHTPLQIKMLTSFWYNICGQWVMAFNAAFNNISVISLRSVLLVEETGEIHQPAARYWQTLSHNVVSSTLYYIERKRWKDKISNNVGKVTTSSCYMTRGIVINLSPSL